MRGSKVIYSGCGWDLTVRELLFSMAIILVMLTGGFFISEKISSKGDELNQEYYQAMRIDGDSELFSYGMRTSVGNAFVKGTLRAVDTVTDDDIEGEYLFIRVEEEHYNKHTRTVTDYDKDGKVKGHHTETYYEWDYYDSWDKHSEKVSFLDAEFDYGKIDMPMYYHVDTIKKSRKVRYKYFVRDTEYDGVLYADLRDNTIGDKNDFIRVDNIEKAIEYKSSSAKGMVIGFWGLWIVFICGAVYGFCYLDNRWLED